MRSSSKNLIEYLLSIPSTSPVAVAQRMSERGRYTRLTARLDFPVCRPYCAAQSQDRMTADYQARLPVHTDRESRMYSLAAHKRLTDQERSIDRIVRSTVRQVAHTWVGPEEDIGIYPAGRSPVRAG